MRGLTSTPRPPPPQIRRVSYAVYAVVILSLVVLYRMTNGSLPQGIFSSVDNDRRYSKAAQIDMMSAYEPASHHHHHHYTKQQQQQQDDDDDHTTTKSVPPHLSKFGYVAGPSEFVLILGGGGPVGRALKQKLRERGVAILSVDNRDVLDLREPDALSRAFEFVSRDISFVYLLASDVSSSRASAIDQSTQHRDFLWASSEALHVQVFSWLQKHAHMKLIYVSSHVTATVGGAATTNQNNNIVALIKARAHTLASTYLGSRSRTARLWHVVSDDLDDTCIVSEVMNQCLVRNAATIRVSKSMMGHLNLATASEVAQGLVAMRQHFDDLPATTDLAPSHKLTWTEFVAAVDAAVVALPSVPFAPTQTTGCRVTLTMVKDGPQQHEEPSMPKDTWFRDHVSTVTQVKREIAIASLLQARHARFHHGAEVGLVVRVSSSQAAQDWTQRLKLVMEELAYIDAPSRLAILVSDFSQPHESPCKPHTSDATCNAMSMALHSDAFARVEHIAYVDDRDGKLFPPTRTMVQSLIQRRRFAHSIYLVQKPYLDLKPLPFTDKRRVIGLCNCDKACAALPDSVFFAGTSFSARFPTPLSLNNSAPTLAQQQRQATCDMIPNVIIAHRRVWLSVVWPSTSFLSQFLAQEQSQNQHWNFPTLIAALAMTGCGHHGISSVVLGQPDNTPWFDGLAASASCLTSSSPSTTTTMPTFLHRVICAGSMLSFSTNPRNDVAILSDLKPIPVTLSPTTPPVAPTSPPVVPCYPECTVMPVIVAWPAVIAQAREIVGIFTQQYRIGGHSGIVVVSQDLTYKQVAELTSIENVVVVSRERMNRPLDILDPVSLQLHGFELAMSTLPAQPLVLIDVRRKGATGVRFPELDELRHHCGAGVPIQFDQSSGHLPHILIPGRDNAECKKKRTQLRDWVQSTQTCVERVWEPGLPVPSKEDCAAKAMAFLESWIPAPPKTGLTQQVRMPNAEICSLTHIRRSPDVKDLRPIPTSERRNSICIGTPTLGKVPWAEHPMFRNLLRTLVAGISVDSPFVYRHYVVYEDGDPVLDTVQGMRDFVDQWKETWKSVMAKHEVFPVRVPFAAGDTNYLSNVIFHQAYEDGCEYLWYLCDDISIQNKPWDVPFVDRMRKANPPNVGMVGTPLHFNTQPFVHRSHLDVHGIFYPRETHNWYGDTTVYDSYKVAGKMNGPSFEFSNANSGGERYRICMLNHNPLVDAWVSALKKYEARMLVKARSGALVAL